MGKSHPFRYLSLRKSSGFSRLDQLAEKTIVNALVRGRPSLARFTGFGFLDGRHISSVVNA